MILPNINLISPLLQIYLSQNRTKQLLHTVVYYCAVYINASHFFFEQFLLSSSQNVKQHNKLLSITHLLQSSHAILLFIIFLSSLKLSFNNLWIASESFTLLMLTSHPATYRL